MNESIADIVYEVVRSIPRGSVATYKTVARLAGVKNPRYIGYLLHHNPDEATIPCHRVVNAVGRLAPAFAFGGPDVQKARLHAEQVLVHEGRVDLARYGWDGEVNV
jgi:methylated-DNA-protein-cysteine methyltransferase-like protein